MPETTPPPAAPAGREPLTEFVRDARAAAGLTVAALAERCDLSPVVVASYERGDRTPPLPKLRKLLEALGYTLQPLPAGGESVAEPNPPRYGVRLPGGKVLACDTADEARQAAWELDGEVVHRVETRLVGPWRPVPDHGRVARLPRRVAA